MPTYKEAVAAEWVEAPPQPAPAAESAAPAYEDRALDAELPGDFDEQSYVELNPEVFASGMLPAQHYIAVGHRRGLAYKKADEVKAVTHWTYPSFRTEGHISAYGMGLVRPKIIAFYLPQYHRVKENDEWWGKGFTEWTNVRKAKPNFVGHNQPHVPLNNNYYDLADSSVQVKQSALASEYGVNAFCYYMYWFNGRSVLETPLDQMLANKDVKSDFCICWANENWTKTWDGKDKDVLLAQNHSLESDRHFIRDAMKYFADPRYLRVAGKLVFLVYRVDLIPNCEQTAAVWREEVRKAGLGEIHLCAVQFYGITDPTPWGFDAAVEFPPHGWLEQVNLPDQRPEFTNDQFSGHVFSYPKSVDFALRKPLPSYQWYRGVFPGWDNTARRQNTGHIFRDSHPLEFERWLTAVLRQQVINSDSENQIVFINAWNEWGEGAHLEPDEHCGLLNLQAVHSALSTVRGEREVLGVLKRLRAPGLYEGRAADEFTLLNYLKGREQTIAHLAGLAYNATGT